MNRLKKAAGVIVLLNTSTLLAFCLLELAYRYQIVDFYSLELKALNKSVVLSNTHQKVLVLGDSFSAQQDGYVNYLQDSLAGFDVINSAIPGTSMREMHLIARQRISEFKPEVLILQVYPGNDLIDISHPVNFNSVSPVRNIYWLAVDRFWSLGWVNYKLAPLRKLFDREQSFSTPLEIDSFSVDRYSERVKLLLKADPYFLNKSFNLSDDKYQSSFKKMSNWINEIINTYKSVSPNGKVIILVIPHCTNTGSDFYINYKKLGAYLDSKVGSETAFTTKLRSNFPNTRVVDATSNLLNANNNGVKCYFYNDEHLTSRGSNVIYRFIANELN